MSLENEMIIEIEGLSKTIIQYTNDTYIRSYASRIQNLDFVRQREILVILIEKLIGWYQTEIELIRCNEYVVNKNAHFKSYELLQNWYERLQMNYE